MDKKMEMLCDKEIWSNAIQHGLDKHIDKSLLSTLTNPIGRLAIIEAIEQGRYKIEPPVVQQIPKPNGKIREVFCNSQMDRVVLSVINEIYYKLYSKYIHPNCVSYQKNTGVPKIIKSLVKELDATGKGYKADLSKYFDNVNRETVNALLDSLSTGSPVDRVVWNYYNDDHIVLNGVKTERYKSLCQGCSIGTLLANLCLKDIDEEISKLDVVYYRYSDDLLFIGKDAEKALEILKQMLIPKGLSLNRDKVQAIDITTEFTFLGAKIKGKEVDISDESVERFKKKIKAITKMRKGMKIKSRSMQRKMIKEINYYIREAYAKSTKNFGWEQFFYSLINTNKTIVMLDEYVKDHLKHAYTGKWNHTTNMHKTSNEQLREMGYKSMVQMYNLFKINKDVYNAELQRIS